MEMENAVAGLSALAHEGRLTVFRMLVQAGPDGIAAGDIARGMNVPPNTLSTNLAILSHAGLIDRRRNGRSIIYRASYATMTALLDYLMTDCCGGSPEICASLADIILRSRCEGTPTVLAGDA